MAKVERMRQEMPQSISPDDLARQAEQGWKLVAVEWERELPESEQAARAEEIPFGLQISQDASRLEENPHEQEVLQLMMELTVHDGPYSAIADELNRRGYRTRDGFRWTADIGVPDVAAADRSWAEDLRHARMATTRKDRVDPLSAISVDAFKHRAPRPRCDELLKSTFRRT